MATYPAITSQKERYGSVDGERRGGPRLHDVCRVVGLLDDDCRDSGVGRKEHRPVHKTEHFQSRTATFFTQTSFFTYIHINVRTTAHDEAYSYSILGNMH